MDKLIYLDNAATTKVDDEVVQEMLPYFTEIYGNSNSLHRFGLDANKAVNLARERIANALNCSSNEIYFTSGGTEANNWVIKGVAEGNKHKGKRIIVSEIEHHSIMDSVKTLSQIDSEINNENIDSNGYDVLYIPVDEKGIVSLHALKEAVNSKTTLVSIMFVNNETGSIQPIKDIVKIVKEKNPNTYVHVDCVQAFPIIKIDVKDLGIDFATISSHKIHGPKGVGALYIRKGCKIARLIEGGGQEKGMRGGTTNVPAIVGFGSAVELNEQNREKNVEILTDLSKYFIEKITAKIPYIKINCDENVRACQIVNVSFDLVEGESILLWLNKSGIAVSTGSACASNILEKSHVLSALGLPHQLINGTVRFSFGTDLTKDDIDFVVEELSKIVEKLRLMSPLKEKDVCIMKK